MLASVEALVAPMAQAKGIAYSVRECDGGIVVAADEERVRQILINLVTNAVKFTHGGGWVAISCETVGDRVRIRVHDNGRGIPADKLETVFDPFMQLGRTLNRPEAGVGLGLAISRDLARGMGGDVTVESTPGQGSIFTLELPAG